MAFAGLLQVGVELGLDAILVKPKRQIGDFVAQVTIEEEHFDELDITQQPVEKGAVITDHAYKRPKRLVIVAGWSNTPSSNGVGSSSSVLGSLAGAVTGTIGGVVDLATQANSPFNGISAAVGQLSDTVTRPLSLAGQFVSSAVSDVQGALSSAGAFVNSGVDAVKEEASSLVSNVTGGLSGALDISSNLSNGIGGGLASALNPDNAVAGLNIGGIDGDNLASTLTGNQVGGVVDTYQKFIALQESLIPFDVFTGKRYYKNMLIRNMMTKTTKETENALYLRMELQEVIIVSTATAVAVTSDQSAQAQPEDTAPTSEQGDAQLGDATTYNSSAGDSSINADPPGTPQAGA